MMAVQVGIPSDIDLLLWGPYICSQKSCDSSTRQICNSHRNQLSERYNDRKVTKPAKYVPIYQTRWSAIGEAIHEDTANAVNPLDQLNWDCSGLHTKTCPPR